MRNPNGYGSIIKLNGKRRKPYRVRITIGWEIDTTTGKRKQIFKDLGTYATQKEATLALAEYNGNPYDLNAKTTTFDDVYQLWIKPHEIKHPSSNYILRLDYNKYFDGIKDKPITHLRLQDIQGILDLVKDMSNSVQDKIKYIIRTTYEEAVKRSLLTNNISTYLTTSATKPKKLSDDKYFSRDEIKRILDTSDLVTEYPGEKKGTHTTINLCYTMKLLLYTGLRIEELLNIKTYQVDIKGRMINVHGTKTENARRLVPIHKEIIPILQDHIGTGSKYLVADELGNQVSYQRFRLYFYDIFMEKLGIENKTPHATRHTFISNMDNCGIDSNSVVLKRIVGHASTNTTQTYTHKDQQALIEAIDKYQL